MSALQHYSQAGWQANLFGFAARSGSPAMATFAATSMRHVAAKLLCEPRHRVLDIACGGGHFADYLSKVSGAHVVGLGGGETAGELCAANDRFTLNTAAELGAADPFDRLVYLDAFTKTRNFKQFFTAAAASLKKESVVVLQGVASHVPTKTGPPAMSQILPHVETAFFVVKDLEIMHDDFTASVRAYRGACAEAGAPACSELEDLAAGLEAGRHFAYQLQLARHALVVPFTRDYVAENTAALAEREKALGLSS